MEGAQSIEELAPREAARRLPAARQAAWVADRRRLPPAATGPGAARPAKPPRYRVGRALFKPLARGLGITRDDGSAFAFPAALEAAL